MRGFQSVAGALLAGLVLGACAGGPGAPSQPTAPNGRLAASERSVSIDITNDTKESIFVGLVDSTRYCIRQALPFFVVVPFKTRAFVLFVGDCKPHTDIHVTYNNPPTPARVTLRFEDNGQPKTTLVTENGFKTTIRDWNKLTISP